ncbi:transketolase [Alkalibacterium sp. f15]|uniref:transketolase n=1 Tax=Alkalibacterium sp. f15 TaxID=3414029 RepID=UPI003BF9196D
MSEKIDSLAINTLRTFAMDAVEEAQSGHMGLPLGAAPMAYVLWKNHLTMTPEQPTWFNRDRFILSAGHGSMLLYGLLHLSGYNLSLDDLKAFREIDSQTPGHPELHHTEGVEVTTGPLGQGLSMAVGIAMAERKSASLFNTENRDICNYYTYVLCGDGDLMEGVSHEAISIAGHLNLNKLIVLYDSNQSSLDEQLEASFSDNIQKKFEAVNWDYIKVDDGNNIDAIDQAIEKAKLSSKPSLIEVNTVIGYGLPDIAGTHDAHSDPVGSENILKAKAALGWEYTEPFYVPEEVYDAFASFQSRGLDKFNMWERNVRKLKEEDIDLLNTLERFINKPQSYDIEHLLPEFTDHDGKLSTRVASSQILNLISDELPELIGGAADLSSSTKTVINSSHAITRTDFSGRNIYFGVREFGMAAIANGLSSSHFIPYVSTYFVFSDYMKPAMRLSALMKLPVIYIFTHDSIAVGKDGPTHQPVEQLAALRSMPNMHVIRPADGNETAGAWEVALNSVETPTTLVLGRQDTKTLNVLPEKARNGTKKGGYTVYSTSNPEGLLIATGSEVELALMAKTELEKEGIHVNVVSMPCFDLFEGQSQDYKERVLPKHLKKRLSIEMGASYGWKAYVGDEGSSLSVDSFGCSGDPDDVMRRFGFTVENVVSRFKQLLS